MTIAGRFGFAPQGFKLIPGLKLFVLEDFCEAFAFFPFKKHNHFVAHGQDIYDLAFPFGGDHPLVAFGSFLRASTYCSYS